MGRIDLDSVDQVGTISSNWQEHLITGNTPGWHFYRLKTIPENLLISIGFN